MNVLIIRPSALGDTLMLMPAIIQLRASAEIILVGRYPGLYFLKPYVHRCIDYEGSGWHTLFLERPDYVHALPITTVDKVVAFLSDPERRVKDNLKTCFSSESVYLFPAFPPKREKTHVALYLSRCLEMAGLPIDAGKSFEEALMRPLIERETMSNQQKKIVLHPGSGGKKKNHPPSFWLKLIKDMRKRSFNEKFIFLLGPTEEPLHSFYRNNLCNKDIDIVFSPEKGKLSSLLKKAYLYIGHDSGITHLAAMLGTPTIALFKNSSIHQWRPLGPAVRVIENKEAGPSLITTILKEAGELSGNSKQQNTNLKQIPMIEIQNSKQ